MTGTLGGILYQGAVVDSVRKNRTVNAKLILLTKLFYSGFLDKV